VKLVCFKCGETAPKLIRSACNRCYMKHYHAGTLDELPLTPKPERGKIIRTEKLCPRCDTTKPIESFSVAVSRADGRMGWCKSCYADWRREQGGDHFRDYELRRNYGITLKDYNALFDKQGGACAICLQALTARLHVDHCHNSKEVRGLLCTSCNNGLGRFKDRPDLLEAAAAYLRR
jgi:hypothetical protein